MFYGYMLDASKREKLQDQCSTSGQMCNMDKNTIFREHDKTSYLQSPW